MKYSLTNIVQLSVKNYIQKDKKTSECMEYGDIENDPDTLSRITLKLKNNHSL